MKELTFKEALKKHAEGKTVYYTYHTSPTVKHYIGGISLDHARRNTSWYKYFVENKSLGDDK